MRAILAMVVAGVLAGCSQGGGTKVDAAAPEPSDAMRQTFTSCTWGETRSTHLSIWSYACGPGAGDVKLVANGAGFDIESGGERRRVIRVFEKPADAPIDAILPAVRLVSRGPAATCTFIPMFDDTKRTRFALFPTGAVGASFRESVQNGALADPPCGELGVAMDGYRIFEPLPGHPDMVVYIDFGSEIQIFDAGTLKVIAP